MQRKKRGASLTVVRWLLLAAVVTILVLLVVLLSVSVKKGVTVGICYAAPMDSSNSLYRQTLQEDLSRRGYRLLILDADLDQAKQLDQITAMSDRGCQLLLIEPVMLSARQELSDKIAATGLPAVFLTREAEAFLQDPAAGICCVSTQPELSGVTLAQMVQGLPMGGDINGDGIISCLVITGPEGHIEDAARLTGFQNEMQAQHLEVQILSHQAGDWTEASGLRICSSQLSDFGRDIEVILCGNGAMAMGASQAVEKGGWQVGRDMYILGIDTQNVTAPLIGRGKITGMVFTDPVVLARQAAAVAVAMLEGRQAELPDESAYVAVNMENIHQYIE